jgi:NAD(P)-dependent dehydrogenase (short-subunit alcohol dehydrogenase family)
MKNVLITGASRGLGYSLAEGYAAQGFYVIACARDINSDHLQKFKAKYKDNVRLLNMDVSETDSVDQAAFQTEQTVAGLDILINNAAVHSDDSFAEIEKINVDHCLETFNINAVGALRVTKAFIRLLENGTSKELVNISSEAGSISNCQREKEFDYCMSKAALNMESKLLQNYLKGRNIKVLAIHPGWMRTDMGGPNADLSVNEAAANVIGIIDQYKDTLEGPVYVDYSGKPLNF